MKNSILQYRPNVEAFSFKEAVVDLQLKEIKGDQIASVYLPSKYFSLLNLKENDAAAVFLSEGDASYPSWFAMVHFHLFQSEVYHLSEESCIFINVVPAPMDNQKNEKYKTDLVQMVKTGHMFVALFIPTYLWNFSCLYFDRVLISTPSPLNSLLTSTETVLHILEEKINFVLRKETSLPLFKRQSLIVNHNLDSFFIQILEITISSGSQTPPLEYKGNDPLFRSLLDFLNCENAYYLPSPNSVIIIESGCNTEMPPLYFKGSPFLATGISEEMFSHFCKNISILLAKKSCSSSPTIKSFPIPKTFLIEGYEKNGTPLLFSHLLRKLHTEYKLIPYVACIDCTKWHSVDDIDQCSLFIKLTLKRAIDNRPSIIQILNYQQRNSSESNKTNLIIQKIIEEKLLDLIFSIPGIAVIFIRSFDSLQGDEYPVYSSLSCTRFPSFDCRFDICKDLFRHTNIDDQEVIRYLANKTQGYLYEDLCKVISFACNELSSVDSSISAQEPDHCLVIDRLASLSLKHDHSDLLNKINEGLKLFPASIRHDWSICIPQDTWDDIGGKARIKQLLIEAVEWPIQYPDRFIKFGISPPKGILLYGPPGNSKTMLAKALAAQCKLNFMAIKGPQDELDSIGGIRGSDGSTSSSGIGDRLLTQLLIELDGFNPLNKVTFIGATNRPDILDPALLRPGRIDRLIYVGLPDLEERIQVFQIQAKKMPFEDEQMIIYLATKTEGYSCAELVALCQRAGFGALERDINCKLITKMDFEKALEKVQPITGKKSLESYYKNFQLNYFSLPQ